MKNKAQNRLAALKQDPAPDQPIQTPKPNMPKSNIPDYGDKPEQAPIIEAGDKIRNGEKQ